MLRSAGYGVVHCESGAWGVAPRVRFERAAD